MADDPKSFQDAFRAAKAAREGSKMSKEQLRALKARKAEAVARTRTPEAEAEAQASMPPPPPRQTTAPLPGGAASAPARSYHADSQATRMNDGGITSGEHLHSEPSVNKLALQAHQQSSQAVRSVAASTGAQETEAMHVQGQGSMTGGFVDGGVLLQTRSQSAKSMEGSTGGGEARSMEENGAARADALTTSAQSTRVGSWGNNVVAAAVSSQAAVGSHDIPEAAASAAIGAPTADPKPHSSEKDIALPANFFQPVGSGGTPGEGMKLDKEYEAFMAEVQRSELEDGLAVGGGASIGGGGGGRPADDGDGDGDAGPAEDDEDAKEDRDDFEHFVRRERVRELREAASRRSKAQGETMEAAAALELAGVMQSDAVIIPKVHVPTKRKRPSTNAALDGDGEGSGDSGDDDDGADEALLWRAKRSAAS